MPNTSRYAWYNGQLIESERATLHVLTPALHYGLGVFEGIRCYATDAGPAVFRLREHMERLLRSASILGFRSFPYSVDELVAATVATVAASGMGDCYIRPLAYLVEGGWNLDIDGGRPDVSITVWEWNAYLGDAARSQGVRANVSSFTRHHPNATMTKAKICGNYANSVLAKTESRRLGFDEAIMLDPDGYVAECTGENIFIVKDGCVFTPHGAAILEGITRAALMTLASDLGITVQETMVTRDAVYGADEVFVCGTAAEVIGLVDVDFRRIGNGAVGPITRALQDAYHDAVRGRGPRAAGWLTPVPQVAPAARLSGGGPAA